MNTSYKGKELVRAGHAFAAAIAAETPLIEIAKMVSNLASALDVQIVRAQQLAAESAALKSNLMFWDAEDPESPYDHPDEIASECEMDYGTEFTVQVAARMPNRVYRVVSALEYSTEVELIEGGEVKTPSLDAFLASLRAEGVDGGIERIMVHANHQHAAVAQALHILRMYSAQLRSQSAPSPEAAAIARQFEQVKGV
ncbi:Hypothetical protein AKI40_2465 [Enterobacter sp. FY-07]|uniref:hypothetical protein n=1 Tax=Kosakonia oryzendophytica TaxID=1005665 RepID=UPI000777E82C|nr:hypothetical protein [Kosakonia oryzendophytica]AMO48863.1 Hypothetical protein AKI40_2465 [Enterobacter sp. FY-07]WBT56630.1 hypothetical protein O9K67_15790 [Kosakonia oryzendophytica]